MSKVGNTDVPLLFQNKDFDKESTNSEKEDLEEENEKDEDENSDAESTTINNPNATAKSKKPSKTFKKNLSKSISQLQTLKQKSGKNALKAKRATKFSKKGTTKSKRAKFYHPKKKTDWILQCPNSKQYWKKCFLKWIHIGPGNFFLPKLECLDLENCNFVPRLSLFFYFHHQFNSNK